MTTYGDLMTQILIFFALLFALSSVDTKKFDIYISSLQGSLGIIQGGQTLEKGEFIESGEVGQFLVSAEEQRQFERLEQDVKDIIKKNDLSGVQVEMDERGLVIRFVEGVLFDSGKAEIKKQAMAVLDKIVPVLKQSRRQIRVEGHTDNVPIHTREFPSNWELSTARAVNVVRYFIDKHNFSPYTISAAGYGEYRPVAPNDTDKHRALNRRVDIVILKSVSEDEEPE
jgi:chemotaxis protein MotB